MAAHGFMPSILLVKDVPANLPVNISAMEQGWILYRCDRAQAPRPPAAPAATSSEQPADPCMLVNMNKVQRKWVYRWLSVLSKKVSPHDSLVLYLICQRRF